MAQEGFGDIPLFREIQRLLAAGEGPINYELARQVAGAITAGAGSDLPSSDDERKAFRAAVQEAERLVAGFTRMGPAEPMRVMLVTRSEWIASTLQAWRWLFDRLALRFTAVLAGDGPTPEAGTEPPQASLHAAVAHMAPLLLGIQTGTLLGNLATRALGRYDLPIPRDDDGYLFFVAPNLHAVMADYSLDEGFRPWIAVHDAVVHLIVNVVPWLASYHKSLVTDVIDAIEIDTSELERRLTELQTTDLGAVEYGAPGVGALPLTPTDRWRRSLARLRAFDALIEGYRHITVEAVAEEVIRGSGRYAEGLGRHLAAGSEAEALLGSVLGLAPDRALLSSGTTFCAAVCKLKGIGALNRAWDAPDNVPTLDEIKDPFAWMDRVLS